MKEVFKEVTLEQRGTLKLCRSLSGPERVNEWESKELECVKCLFRGEMSAQLSDDPKFSPGINVLKLCVTYFWQIYLYLTEHDVIFSQTCNEFYTVHILLLRLLLFKILIIFCFIYSHQKMNPPLVPSSTFPLSV